MKQRRRRAPQCGVTDPYLMLAFAEGFGERTVPALLAPDLDPMRCLAEPPSPPEVPPRTAARLRLPDLAARADRGLWSGADPRIVTLRRERDEATAEVAALWERLADAERERDEAKDLNQVNLDMAVWKHDLWKGAERQLAEAREALREVLAICHTRSTGILVSGQRTYAVPVIAEIAGVSGPALASLEGGDEA